MNTILSTPKHSIKTSGRVPNDEEVARIWRNRELSNTDWVVPITDHPQHADYMTYRKSLRDWPDTQDFPLVRPQL